LKIVLVHGATSRLWVFYLMGAAVMALGQRLFFAFTTVCLLLPVFIIVPKALVASGRAQTSPSP
jgi:hypothetical protein